MSIIITILLLQIFIQDDDVKVIVMGALARDFEQIAILFQNFRKFVFIYAKGEKSDYLFSGF